MEMVDVANILGVLLILALIIILYQGRLLSKKDIEKLFPRTRPPEHYNCKSTYVRSLSDLPKVPTPEPPTINSYRVEHGFARLAGWEQEHRADHEK